MKRGDIVLVNLDPVKGSEQGKTRPAVIIQNDVGNKFGSTTIIAPITSKLFLKEYPINVHLSVSESGLDKESTMLMNQVRTIDKSRIIKKISSLDNLIMEKVNLALKVSLALD
ncbi:type II toxin-antitoxin system PemK/MazF family toxin [Nanoarchaeota archaeon]